MSSSDHYNRAEVRTCFCCLDKYGKPKVFKHRSGLSVHKKSKGHKDKEAQWEQFHMQAQIRIQAQNQPAQIQRQIKKKENQVVEFLRKTNETKDIEWIIDNPIEMVSNMNGDLTPLRFSNLDAKLYGFDADYGFQLSERWRLEGVVSVVRGKRLDINDDLYRISPDRTSMALVYEQSNWSASLTLEGVRAQGNVSRTNSEEETAGYGLVHLFGHWQFKQDIKISGGIENLMDLKYAQHLAGYNRVSESEVELGNRLPGTGRNLFLKISLKK